MTLPPFPRDPGELADCGTFASFRFAPTTVEYMVLVRGDTTSTVVRTTARYRFMKGTGELPTECVSTGAFEATFDAAVKQRAEARQ
jgi:hypothetical protein